MRVIRRGVWVRGPWQDAEQHATHEVGLMSSNAVGPPAVWQSFGGSTAIDPLYILACIIMKRIHGSHLEGDQPGGEGGGGVKETMTRFSSPQGCMDVVMYMIGLYCTAIIVMVPMVMYGMRDNQELKQGNNFGSSATPRSPLLTSMQMQDSHFHCESWKGTEC